MVCTRKPYYSFFCCNSYRLSLWLGNTDFFYFKNSEVLYFKVTEKSALYLTAPINQTLFF